MKLQEIVQEVYRELVKTYPQLQNVHNPLMNVNMLMLKRTNIMIEALEKTEKKRKKNQVILRFDKYSDPRLVSLATMMLSLYFDKVLVAPNFEVDAEGMIIDDQMEDELPDDTDILH